VTYRTTYGWEVWDARKREIEELRVQQAQEKAVELQLLRTEDAHLLALGSQAQAREDYETATRYYCARAELHAQSPLTAGCAYLILEDAVKRFSTFPTSAYGIAYLRQYHLHSHIFHRFAQAFGFWSRLPPAQKHFEIDRVHEEAVRLFPSEGRLLKNVCLFWRREHRLDLATKYCQIAAERGLSDDTKSGFAGRLKRLAVERTRSAQPGSPAQRQ